MKKAFFILVWILALACGDSKRTVTAEESAKKDTTWDSAPEADTVSTEGGRRDSVRKQ